MIIFLSLIAGAAGAWLVASHGHIFGLLDEPNHRSSHSTATPKGGGIGILAALVIAVIGLKLNFLFWLPAVILSIVSFYGDRLHMSPKLRLALQFACAGVTLWTVSAAAPCMNMWLIIFFAFFIVGTTNYYNFMDGINGIAGITGIVGFGLLACFSWKLSGEISNLCLSMAAGCLGFLPFNMPRARVFMGDVGSILLGFVFAVTVIMLADSITAFICMASFIFPYYADELISVLIRLKNHRNLLEPHRGHLYQLLANELKIPHWKISVSYGIIQLVIAGGAIYLEKLHLIYLCLWLMLFLLFFALAYYIAIRIIKCSAGIPACEKE
ncbi:MAG: glycosyltransferase family 4 protein [Lentisphaerota bacterium]